MKCLAQVNTTSEHKNFQGDVLLALGYLVSYEHMGFFSVECLSGCACEGIPNHSATHQSHSSIFKFVYFAATQNSHCRLRITSLNQTESGEHKVKFDSIMVATGISSNWVNDMNHVYQS